MSRTVNIDEMADAINEGLKEYATLASTEVKKAVRKSAKTVKEQIQSGAPSRTGRYKESWVATKQVHRIGGGAFQEPLPAGTSAGKGSCQARRRSCGRKTPYCSGRTGRYRAAPVPYRKGTEVRRNQ